MSSLNDAKIIGGIGALLTLFGIISTGLGVLIAFFGFILVIIAVKYFSEEVKDNSIFNNFLYFFIVSIIAVVIAGAILAITFIEMGGMSMITQLQNKASDPIAVWETIEPYLSNVIIALVILWALLIIGVIFLRKSFDRIGEITKVKWFHTTGLLYLIGAVTLIVMIGFIIILIAMIIEIIAFFSLPEKLPEKTK